METIIIDAYNLMHKVSELKQLLKQSQEVCVDSMVAKLENHFFNARIKITVVFDGHGKNKSHRNIEVKFAKTDVGTDYGNADALIKHLIEGSKNPKLLKVVSSDKEIAWFAKDCGCRIQSSESFWNEVREKRIERIEAVKESNEKPEKVTKAEHDFLLKEFTKK